jgi:hypothetical protein
MLPSGGSVCTWVIDLHQLVCHRRPLPLPPPTPVMSRGPLGSADCVSWVLGRTARLGAKEISVKVGTTGVDFVGNLCRCETISQRPTWIRDGGRTCFMPPALGFSFTRPGSVTSTPIVTWSDPPLSPPRSSRIATPIRIAGALTPTPTSSPTAARIPHAFVPATIPVLPIVATVLVFVFLVVVVCSLLVVVPISLLVVIVRLVTVLSPAAVAVVVIVILVVIAVIIIVPLAVVIMLAVIRLLLSVLVLILVICIIPWLVLGVLSAGLIGLRIAVGGSPACGMAFRRISPPPLVGGRV